MRLTFEHAKWLDFHLTEFFTPEKGNQNNMASLRDGGTPLVSAKKCDNGYKQFVDVNDKKLFEGEILTLNNDGDGGAGIAYYQPFIMALDSHCTALKPKIPLSRYQLLFIAMCITKQRERFGHGYSINSGRLRSFRLMLPITANKQPDWQFMEDYMREQEMLLLKPAMESLSNRLNISEIGRGKATEWKEFIFGKEFSILATKSGIDKNKLIVGQGTIPYLTRTDIDNGYDDFISTQAARYKVDEGNVITIGLDTQTVFYQPTFFYTGQNIQVVRHPKLDKYNALFLVVAIKKLVERFSWGSYGATLTRLRKSRIYLPADSDGNIDFNFMSAYMLYKEKETSIFASKHFEKRLKA